MTEAKEPTIVINGAPLTSAQVMTLRVAISSFLMEMKEHGAFGEDQTGESIRKAYLERGGEVMKLMIGNQI